MVPGFSDMVMFFELHRSTVDPKSSSCLPMTGEDTGLGVSASPLAGYLGKVLGRTTSLESCPWCTSKGFTYSLHSYRINFQESIVLCTNPQCLFPLVSRPLEDVLASLDPVEPTVGSKRKISAALEKEEPINPLLKRIRSSEEDNLEPQSGNDSPVSPAEQGAGNPVGNGQHATPETHGKQLNGYHEAPLDAETNGWASLQNTGVDQESGRDQVVHVDDHTPPIFPASVGCLPDLLLVSTGKEESAHSPHIYDLEILKGEQRSPPVPNSMGSSQDICVPNVSFPSILRSEQTKFTEERSLIADTMACKNTESIELDTNDFSCSSVKESDEVSIAPQQFLWSNSDNLCWLDSLLAALVNCKSLKCKPEEEPKQSTVWKLMKEYEAICTAVQEQQQINKDGVSRVSRRALHKASVDLQTLRMSVFRQLQPKLHCTLGQRETPVFAMPLLLTMDSWVERLFQTTFHWEFKCSECKVTTKERVIKTLPTFTNVVPNWHPLHAAHFAPCNACSKKNQMRTMLLQRVPPVFVLHFVEGLPDNDVSIYAFNFKGKRYSITTVIQYNQELKHFVTWFQNNDGLWLEYDDLKHPDCLTHQKLQVPAHEMHIIFWEVEDDAESSVCSPSTTFVESTSPEKSVPPLNEKVDGPLAVTPDQSLLMPHDDTDIICALAGEDSSNIMDTTVTASNDTSIGATTLLDTFEGLTHNDIITLTLVELKPESETQLLNDNHRAQDINLPPGSEKLDSTPDSSSYAGVSNICHSTDVDPSTIQSLSDTEPKDDSCDPSKIVSGRTTVRHPVNGQEGKNAAPHTSPPTSSEPFEAVSHKSESPAAQDNTPPVKITQQAPPVFSTNTSPLGTSQESSIELSALGQNARWSFLLSKHPLNPIHKSITKFAPTPTQVNPSHLVHSTPNPVKGQPMLGGLTKQPLSTEESEGLPPKAAEMYGGFGTKCEESKHIISPPPLCDARQLSEMCMSKKWSSQSSKVPPSLSETEALRYKLLKKLKAKKKKLAKLNSLLVYQRGPCLQPDSTYLNSPSTVSSSTYDGSTCDDFLSDLLSPATTVSNLSPDSTGFLEMLASGKEGATQLDCLVSTDGAASQSSSGNGPDTESFLEDFLSQCCGFDPV